MNIAAPTVLVRLPNWVGDVCMALPALARLRRAGMRVVALGKGFSADLVAASVDGFHKLPTRGVPELVRSAQAQQGLLLTNSFSSAWQFRRGGLAAVGHRGDWRSWLLRTAVRRTAVHEVTAFWDLAGAIVGGSEPPPPTLGLEPPAAQQQLADAALAGIPQPFAVLAPLAVGTVAGRSKQWPGFPLLCRMLAERMPVVACPGPGEDAAMARALPGARILNGLGLGAYALVMRRARLVIANDSGPMHLAAAVGAPVIGVFGVSDPARTRPWHPRARTLGNQQGWPSVDAVAAAMQAELA